MVTRSQGNGVVAVAVALGLKRVAGLGGEALVVGVFVVECVCALCSRVVCHLSFSFSLFFSPLPPFSLSPVISPSLSLLPSLPLSLSPSLSPSLSLSPSVRGAGCVCVCLCV